MKDNRRLAPRTPVKTALALAIALTGTALLAAAGDARAPSTDTASTPAASASTQAPQRRHPGHGPREVDLAEAEKRAMTAFDRVDSNDDDRISPAEIAAAGPAATGPHGFGRHRDGRRGFHGRPGHGGMGPRWHGGPPPEGAPDDDANVEPGGDDGGARPDREQMLGSVFQRLDADKDGRLSADEFTGLRVAQRAEIQARHFARMDANGDGSLSRTEFPPMLTHLRQLDANKDGKVTRDEFPARGARQRDGHGRSGDAAPRT